VLALLDLSNELLSSDSSATMDCVRLISPTLTIAITFDVICHEIISLLAVHIWLRHADSRVGSRRTSSQSGAPLSHPLRLSKPLDLQQPRPIGATLASPALGLFCGSSSCFPIILVLYLMCLMSQCFHRFREESIRQVIIFCTPFHKPHYA
jgi:hypothetical protein